MFIGNVKNIWAAAVFAGIGLGQLGSAAAQAPSSLAECVEQALVQAAGEGPGRRAPRIERRFLLAGEARVYPVELERGECRGFLAVGATHVQDVELRVQDLEGKLLASLEGPTTTPFLMHCAAADDERDQERVVVVLRVRDGQGEVAFAQLRATLLDANVQLALTRCSSVGTPRPAAVDVGAEPPAPTLDAALAARSEQLARLGYHELYTSTRPIAGHGDHDASMLRAEPGRCYALVAVGDENVLDLDVRLFDPQVSLDPIAQDITRRSDAVLKFCAQGAGRYLVDASTFQGEGSYALSLFVLNEPASVPAGVTNAGRISYAETVQRMRARGFETAVVDSGVLVAGTGLSTPVTLDATRCYAFAAISGNGAQTGKLELALLAADGELLGLDGRSTQDPWLFDCPTQSVTRQVVVRTKDPRRAERFVLLIGRDADAAQAAAKALPGAP